MAASYPSSAKSFSAINAGDTVTDTMWEEAYDEITALEQALLTNGLAHTLFPDATANARTLGTASKHWGIAFLKGITLLDATELTIASGAVTVTSGYHAVDTESDAASDDLATLTATGLTAGHLVVLRAENVSRVVTLKDGTGNLLLNGDYALSATDRTITLIYDGTNWRELARSVGSGAAVWTGHGGAISSGQTVYLGGNTFNATEATAGPSPLPVAMTVSQLRVVGSVAPGSGQSFVFTVRKNGSDTAQTATIADTDTAAADTSNSVSFAAGDRISIKVVASGSAAGSTLSAAVRLT